MSINFFREKVFIVSISKVGLISNERFTFDGQTQSVFLAEKLLIGMSRFRRLYLCI